MSDAERRDVGEAVNSLLTASERDAERMACELRKRSEELIRKSQWVARPKEFLHRFPPPPPTGDPS